MKTPKTPGEFQKAADAAWFALLFASAKSFGLIDVNGVVDLARTLDLQARCKALGYVSRAEAVEMVIHGIARGGKKG